MIDYSKWKKDDDHKVSSILLDHLNPRFSHNKAHLSQNELINEMIEKYQVYDLAKSIVNDGYFPDKVLVVIEENGKLFVVEGNRRLSALKCLLNPDIVTGKGKDKFVKLSTQIDKHYVDSVGIVIAPSREAANPIIFKEHTGNTAMPWSRIMQAEFYVRQISNGQSIEDIEKEYHRTRSEINKFLKLYYMYNIARNLTYDKKEIQDKVEDKQDFPASVLERIYDSSTMKRFLGISFDSYGNVKGERDKKEFENAYKTIVTDIVNKEVHTRTLNKEKDFKDYSKKLDSVKPTKSGKFTYKDFVKEDEKSEGPDTPAKLIKKSVRKATGIIPRGLPFGLKSASNLQKNYDELRKLPVKTYPNTTAVMLRVFVDKALRMYLKKCHIKEIPVKKDGKDISAKISDVLLGEIIDFITARETKIISDDNVKKVLRKYKSSSDISTSLSALNSVTHNEEFSLTEPDVRNNWLSLEGLFRVILTEPSRKND